MVLIGVDGTLLAEGEVEEILAPEKPTDFRVRVSQLLDGEIQKVAKGWGEDRHVRRARALAFGKDDLVGALKVLERAGIEEVPERAEARAELERRFEARLKTIRFCLDEGRFLDAKREASLLAKSVRGHDSWEVALDELTAAFETDAVKKEMQLDRQLTVLLSVLDGPMTPAHYNVDLIKTVRAFAKRFDGTKVAQRAEAVDPLLAALTALTLGIRREELERRVSQ